VAATLAILVSGVLIDRFAGLVPGQAEQSAATVQRVAILYSLLPAALLVVAGLLILRYDITRHRVARNRSRTPPMMAR
jgi:Na+/melibiose symporter-like transporter